MAHHVLVLGKYFGFDNPTTYLLSSCIAIGGTVSVPIHLDCVVTEASLSIDGTQVLDEGRFVLAA